MLFRRSHTLAKYCVVVVPRLIIDPPHVGLVDKIAIISLAVVTEGTFTTPIIAVILWGLSLSDCKPSGSASTLFHLL